MKHEAARLPPDAATPVARPPDVIPPADTRALALAHASRGHRVLPLPADSKVSKLTHDRASHDAPVVAKLFSDWEGKPEHGNIAIMTGDGFMVLDIDKKGGDVKARLADIDARFGPLPRTQIVETPSGGLHFYFRVPEGVYVPNSVGKLAPCVDIRGEGGYVVAPGSTLGGVHYRALKGFSPGEQEIAGCPPRLLAAVQSAAPRRANIGGAPIAIAGEADTPNAIARAVEYLMSSAPDAVEGAGGRQTTMAVAHTLMDWGCLPETAAALMSLHWDERNSPPWGAEDLLSFVVSLAPSRQEPIGARSIENAFEAIGVEAASAAPVALAKRYITADDAERLALEGSGEYLVRGWLDRGTLSVWFGPPGGGKSAVVLGLAMAVAGGVPWADCSTRRGLVVYVALERAKGMRKRIKAARAKMGLPPGLPLVLLDFRPDLATGTRGADEIIAEIKLAEEEFGAQCELVVIDTVARAMNAADGDKAHEMAAFTNRCARIQDATGAHVLLIHHPSKADPKNARGSGALLGATDTEVSVLKGVIEATKESDNGAPTKLHYSLESVVVGKNKSGDVVTAVFANVGAAGVFQLSLTGAELDQMKAFENAQDALGAERGVKNPSITGKQWDEAADALFPGRGAAPTTRRELRRGLTEKGWIAKDPTIPGAFLKATGATEGDGI